MNGFYHEQLQQQHQQKQQVLEPVLLEESDGDAGAVPDTELSLPLSFLVLFSASSNATFGLPLSFLVLFSASSKGTEPPPLLFIFYKTSRAKNQSKLSQRCLLADSQ